MAVPFLCSLAYTGLQRGIITYIETITWVVRAVPAA